MRIYKVEIESTKWGPNWSSITVAARSCEEAIRKAKATFEHRHLRVQSVELLAQADV